MNSPSLHQPNGTQKNSYKTLTEALKNNRCSIVIGPQISSFSGVTIGEALIENLLSVSKPGFQPFASGSISAGYSKHLFKGLIPILRRSEFHPTSNSFLTNFRYSASGHRKQANEIHMLVALLKANYYIDTNYDDLLFDTLDELYKANMHRLVTDANLNHESFIKHISLNGVSNNFDSIVLPFESYEKRFDENPYLFHLLKSIFVQHEVLFIGFSPNDPTLEELIHRLARRNQQKSSNIYLLLYNPTRTEELFFHSIQASFISLRGEIGDEYEMAAIQEFLTQLWQRATGFKVYLDVPQNLPKTYAAKLIAGIELYRLGNFDKAKDQFENIEQDRSIHHSTWVREPGAFAQFAYFYLKTFDKLNDWNGLQEKYKSINTIVEKIQYKIPDIIRQSMNALIFSVLGLARLRAMDFQSAWKYLVSSIEALDSHSNLVSDGELYLHADRHSILAQIYIFRAYFGSVDKNSEKQKKRADFLDRAQKAIEKAEELYKSRNTFNKEKEVHYLGRFYGTKVFLEIAKVVLEIKDYDKVDMHSFIDWAQKSYTPEENRPPYGIIVGKYCEAVSLFFRGKKEDRKDLYDRSKAQLHEILKPKKKDTKISDLILAKTHRLLEVIYSDLVTSSNSGDSKKAAEHHEEEFQAALSRLVEDKNISEDYRGNLLKEAWIFVPIN